MVEDDDLQAGAGLEQYPAVHVGKGHDMGVQGLSCGGWLCETACGGGL